MGVWQSVNTMHEMREFELLNNQIRNCMAALLADQKNTLPGNLWCTAMCAQISDRFGYDQPLPEAGIGWQGIYFVHTPMDSGAIIFQNPRTHAMSNVNCTTQGISANGFGNENETVFDAIAGRVLLFPSWLGYWVQANKSQQKGEEGDRICIRFAFSMSEK